MWAVLGMLLGGILVCGGGLVGFALATIAFDKKNEEY